MNKLSLIVALLLAVLLLQKCKKDTFTETATSSNTLFAIIQDSTWNADTINASLTYTAATHTKVFSCTGIADNKEVNIQITQVDAVNTAGFPLVTYTANGGSDNFSYFTSELTGGKVTWYQQGTVAPGSGTLSFTAIDSVKHQISGTFSFLSEIPATVTIYEVQAGAFNNLPYTFVSQ
jgi:hypothetical protein